MATTKITVIRLPLFWKSWWFVWFAMPVAYGLSIAVLNILVWILEVVAAVIPMLSGLTIIPILAVGELAYYLWQFRLFLAVLYLALLFIAVCLHVLKKQK